MTEPYSSFYVNSYTFTDDTPHRLENNPNLVLASGNIHVYLNDMKYGNARELTGIIRTNAVVWFDAPFRPFDILFQNNVNGANGQVVIIGTVKE